MSILIEQILNEIDQLSLAEQLQVLEHLVKQIKQSVDSVAATQKPKHKLSEFRGMAPNLLGGEDAQE